VPRVVDRLVDAVLKRVGLRLQRRRAYRDPVDHLVAKSAQLGVATLLDVGANEGQFGREMRRAGFGGRIVSFEPLAVCHAKLVQTAAPDPDWHVAPRAALGADDGVATINVSANLVSSSLLPILDRSVETHQPSRYAGTEEVPLRRIDSLRDADWKPPFGLKIDTQGFELEVLKGAAQTLQETPVVLLEMSLHPLYQGAAGFAELYAWMEQAGYRCVGITEGFVNVVTDELLQADALFVRA